MRAWWPFVSSRAFDTLTSYCDDLARQRDLADARADRLATEYARFREQVFARLGALHSPITDTAPVSSRPPVASVFSALAVQSIRDREPSFVAGDSQAS